ncbi:MAG: BlaI/MecI/CopY family transcriptional regulator [Planctomycetota bacterium]
MTKPHHEGLTRREREIVDILYRLGEASVAEVLAAMSDPPSYSAVRALLSLLLRKGHVRHRRDGKRYLYAPRVSAGKASRSALQHLLRTFFDGSVEKVVASVLDQEAGHLSDDELARLAALIEAARKRDK